MYGLAEATLKVTSPKPGLGEKTATVTCGALEQHRFELAAEADTKTATLVSSGETSGTTRIAIVDPDTRLALPEGRIGEIWVTGPGVARGYWNLPEQSRPIFQASLLGDESSKYLRTGDLGTLWNGSLHVTGRLKDCIIIRGENHYPQDIERTVAGSHAAIAPHASAAFSIDDHGIERLVVVSELRRQPRPEIDEIIAAVRSAVSAFHELQAYAVILLKPGRLPRTSSGKVRRRECRQQFLARKLDAVAIDLLQGGEGENAQPARTHASSASGFKPLHADLQTLLRQEMRDPAAAGRTREQCRSTRQPWT